MDSKDASSKNRNCASDCYKDDHDSDIESRLYAEIYYSNTIIGEENNATNARTNNRTPHETLDTSNTMYNNLNNDKQICISVSNNVSSAINIVSDNNIQTGVNLSTHSSGSTQDMNNSRKLNETPKSNKRSFKNDDSNNEADKSNKKKKKNAKKNNKDDIQNKQNTCNTQSNSSNISIVNHQREGRNNLENNANRIINPFNKHLINQQQGMKLLSPEFLNIFFSKKSKSKKNLIQKQTGKRRNKLNGVALGPTEFRPTNTLHVPEKVVQVQVQKNETTENEAVQNDMGEENNQNNLSHNSEVIDINSESSKDSTEQNSKYNMTVATDKKLEIKDTSFKDIESDDSTSTSEESIFEVPVPPKPIPPIIELKDSDNESSSENESDSESSSSESDTQNLNKKSINTTMNLTMDDVYSIDSDSDEPDNIILNCTEIQKGASSLSEIKKMSHQSSILKESMEVGSNNTEISSSQNSVNDRENVQDDSSNTIIKKKVVNSLNNEKHNKTGSNRQNIPLKEYFFQPMSNKMKSFYNESWGGENFDLDELKRKMPTDPNQWAILDDDVLISVSKRKRYFGMVCSICHKEGHRNNQCSEAPKLPVCHMCGTQGHVETSCPNKMCLTCGKKQYMYSKTCTQCEKMFCSRCNSHGHMSYACPDLWRRYHQTISNCNPEVPRNLKTVMKPHYEQFCCNCAKKGHDSASCRRLRWSLHFANPSHVINYNGPPYSKDFDLSTNADVNETHEDSFNLNTTCDVSSNSNDSYNSTINLNKSYEKSPFSQHRRSFTRPDIAEPNKKVIFHISSRVTDIDQVLRNYVLNLDLSRNSGSNNYENWITLTSFLNILARKMPGDFLLERKEEKTVQMRMNFSHKLYEAFSKLLKQYASRTNSERNNMFLYWQRDAQKVADVLINKFNSINNVQEDLLKLYEQIQQLTTELNKENQFVNSYDISRKFNKLALCQQKLLLVLYREGFADDSLKKLKQIYKSISKKFSNKTSFKKNRSSKTKEINVKLISFKTLFQYLYYFNNVFVAYEPKDLTKFIQKYKNHLERCNQLINSSTLFPQKHIVNNEPNRIVNQSNSAHIATSTSQTPSLLMANESISQMIPLLSVNTQITSQTPTIVSINTSITSNSNFSQETSHSTNIISQNTVNVDTLKNFNVQPNNSQSLSKEEKYALYAEKKRKMFINDTKQLLAIASKFNAPHLRKHIDCLQRKLNNERPPSRKEVKYLRRMVKAEKKKQTNGR